MSAEVPEPSPSVDYPSQIAGFPPEPSSPEPPPIEHVEPPIVSEAPALIAEIERLDPPPNEITLSSGTVVSLQALKARQFFKLLRIITRGGATMLPQMGLSMNQEEGEFTANLIALVVFAIPEAEDEALDFVRAMVDVPGITPLTDKKFADQARLQLTVELDNPDLDDLVSIIEAVIVREAPDLKSLGKRMQKMFALAQRTGQTAGIPVVPSATTS